MDLGVAGRRFLVIGGTTGIGLATVEVLAREGARVVVAARDAARVAHVVDQQRRRGLDAAGLVVSADRSTRGDETFSRAVDEHGDIDGLAVVAGPSGRVASFRNQTDEDWLVQVDQQLLMVVRAMRSAIGHLEARGGGTIVTIGAYSVRHPHRGLAPYSAAKAALVSATKNVARYYGSAGIRANCVCPGIIDTPALELPGISAGIDLEQRRNELYRMAHELMGVDNGLGRVGTPEEVGELVAFLLSARAGFTSGAVVNIDGGTEF